MAWKDLCHGEAHRSSTYRVKVRSGAVRAIGLIQMVTQAVDHVPQLKCNLITASSILKIQNLNNL